MKGSFFLITFLLVLLMPSLAGCASGGAKVHMRALETDASVPASSDADAHPFDGGSPSMGMPDAGHAMVTDAGSPAPVTPHPETCNGLDDDLDGRIDEDFLCPLGRMGEICVTSCGANGFRECEAPSCSWGTDCHTFPETCDTIDNDCDGFVDEGCSVEPESPPLMRIRLAPSVAALCPAGWRIRLWRSTTPDESGRGADLVEPAPTVIGTWSSITLWCDERVPQWYVWNAADITASGSGAFAELSLDGVDLRGSTRLCDDPLAPGEGMRPILMWDTGRRGTCPP